MQILNANIRYIRKKYDLTQSELALITNVNRGKIDSYERGTVPGIDWLLIFADHFDINLQLFCTIELNSGNFEQILNVTSDIHQLNFSKSKFINMVNYLVNEDRLEKRQSLAYRLIEKVALLEDENRIILNKILRKLDLPF